jgi:hypothetical protein
MCLSLAAGLPAAGMAQVFRTGQQVYATPTGASNGWYSGCIVQDGRNNRSYQVQWTAEPFESVAGIDTHGVRPSWLRSSTRN